MKNQLQKHRLTVALCAAILFALHAASAGTRTWNGGAVPDGNWTNAANWNGIAPSTNDLLNFAGATQTATTNNFLAGSSFNNIAFNASASPFTLNGNSIVLSSPTDAGSGLIVNGSIYNFSVNTQTIRFPIVLANGNHTIGSTNGGTLKLNGSITHSNGSVLTMFGNINVTGGLSTNGSANGIFGGWAVFSNNWATINATSNVIAYSAYTDVAGGGTIVSNPASNVRIPINGANITLTNTAAVNTLFFGGGGVSGAAQTIAMAGNTLVLGRDGGIFNSTGLGGTYRSLNIGLNDGTRGILTAGDGISPATITFGSAPLPSASGFCTVQSVITDNGSAPVTVVVAGAYVSLNGGGNLATTNTYSGGTYILQGRVSQPGRGTFGSGPVFIVSGGQANMGCQVPNDFYIEGSGTVENNGMGALRLYSASLGTGFTGNLPGTIHLTGLANICADNITVPSQFVGISGKITGPGSLGIGSPTATTRSGHINIGSTNGAFAIPNDYAGDTIINGINGDTRSSILRICDPADNNIMPHGSTGSFAAGPTGNLILNARIAVNQSVFDLNGSTQTVNGVSSTVRDPLDNVITNAGTSASLLILGDNNATAIFGGVVHNGNGGLSLTKIGTGTQTLNGTNTYRGDTIVNAGKLATTTASTGAGNYTVSTNAALGVTTSSAGGTLQVNTLTLAPSSFLQLNVGTNGNPSAAMVNVTNLAINGTVTVSISGATLAPGTFVVLTYPPGSRTGGGNFIMVNSPRVVGSLNDDTVNGIVSVTVTSVDSGIKWNGGVNGDWDINNAANTIWQTVPSLATTFYIENGNGNDSVIFNDTVTGTTNVNLTTTLSPVAITVSNSTKPFVFTGSGRITGDATLAKQGNGTLTISNSGNSDFTGNISLDNGTLIVANDSTFPNAISGSNGTISKIGSGLLTLSGDNSFTGAVSVATGTLRVLSSTALGATNNGTVISNGATLDIGINSVNLDQEPITVSGTGVGGGGAIINSSGAGAFLVSNFKNITMVGDTTFGGSGRLDLRASDATIGTDATLSTGGQPFKLTKVGGNQLQFVGTQVDSALADIDVQVGTFGVQGQVSGLGNPSSALTVFSGATFQLFSVGTVLNKSLVMKSGSIVNNSSGASTFGGPVSLQGPTAVQFNIGGTSLEFTNVISGTGSVSKVTGAGQLTLSAPNTYTGNTTVNAGTLTLLGSGSIDASRIITLGAVGTLDVTFLANPTLTIGAGRSLLGNGTLNGNLVATNGGAVSPGASAGAIGALTVFGNVTLAGTNLMDIDKTAGTNDLISVFNTLTYGGTLVVTSLTAPLTTNDAFALFSAFTYNGTFATIVPATPGNGLAWDTNTLAFDGVLRVGPGVLNPDPSTNAAILSVKQIGSDLVIHGTNNNIPNTAFHYAVLTSTNIALPPGSWTSVTTNSFNVDGTFDYTNTIIPGLPRQFIDVKAVP